MRRFLLGAVLLVAVALLAGGVGFQYVAHTIAARTHAPVWTPVRRAPEELAYAGLDGSQHRLSETRGKVVFLNLWGTWCVQCVAEMPTVQRLYDRYRNDPAVQFVIVSRMDSPQRVRDYAARHSLDMPFYVMRDDGIPQSMRLNQFPSTFLYARSGELGGEHVGAADWSDSSVADTIDRLKAGR